MKRVLFSLLLLTLTAGLSAAGEPITIGETVKLQSEILGEERTILVSTPPGYEGGTSSYAVLYMTDGDGHLTHTRGTVDFLATNGLMPQMIVVGVTNTDRTRDLTPTNATMENADGTPREFPTSGGASKFLDFFEKELFPYIDSQYRTQPLRLFSGHSFGGLFALNTFFTRPEMYHAVLAVSPSLRWDEELPIRQAETFFKDRDELNANLFVAMADELEEEPRPNVLDRLEEQLEAAQTENFIWEVMRMPDETHGSVVLRAHYWGLRKVFAGYQLPRDPEGGGFNGKLADLKGHFKGLSKRFGYTFQPSEQVVNQAGYQVLGREAFDDAIEIFRYNVELYPTAPNPYDSLAEALERAGKLPEALENYSKAVEIAAKADDNRLEIFTANRDRLKEQLDKAETE